MNGKGIPELAAAIDGLVAERRKSGAFAERRRKNMEDRLRTLARFLLEKDLWEAPGAAERVRAAATRVLAGERTPYAEAEDLLKETVR